jgi:sn-glycerol 3-phosphate transport system substrate-binding protein
MGGKLTTARKALFLLACLALLLGLAACGGGGEEQEGEATSSGSPAPGTATPSASTATPSGRTVEISFWHTETASNLNTLQTLVRRFNDSQSEVKVKLAYQGTPDENMAKVLASLRGGDPPNIAYLDEVRVQRLVDTGAFRPLQDFIDAEDYDLSDFNAKAIEYFTVDDKLWAMPISLAVPLLYYNKIPFREVGLDPEKPPTNLEELKEIAPKFVKRDSHGNLVRTCMTLDLSAWMFEVAIGEHGDLYINNGNGRDGRATEVLFNGPTGQAFFQWYHDMLDQDLAINVGRNTGGADSLLPIGAGQAVMTWGSSAGLRSIVDVLEGGLSQIEVELGAALAPGLPGGTRYAGTFGRAMWIPKEHSEEEQQAAWKFIKWMMEPEQQAEWFAGSGYLSVRDSAYDLPAAQEIMAKYPQFQVPVDAFLASPATPSTVGPLLGPFTEVRETTIVAQEEVAVAHKDPIEALNDAAEKSNQIIEEYNQRVQ